MNWRILDEIIPHIMTSHQLFGGTDVINTLRGTGFSKKHTTLFTCELQTLHNTANAVIAAFCSAHFLDFVLPFK